MTSERYRLWLADVLVVSWLMDNYPSGWVHELDDIAEALSVLIRRHYR